MGKTGNAISQILVYVNICYKIYGVYTYENLSSQKRKQDKVGLDRQSSPLISKSPIKNKIHRCVDTHYSETSFSSSCTTLISQPIIHRHSTLLSLYYSIQYTP